MREPPIDETSAAPHDVTVDMAASVRSTSPDGHAPETVDPSAYWRPGSRLDHRVEPARPRTTPPRASRAWWVASAIVVAAVVIAVGLWLVALWVQSTDDDPGELDTAAMVSLTVDARVR